MSVNVTLVVVGLVLCATGLAKLGSSQIGGLTLRNFGISIGSTSTQSNTARETGGGKKANPDWVGLAIAVVGFVTAGVGLFKH